MCAPLHRYCPHPNLFPGAFWGDSPARMTSILAAPRGCNDNRRMLTLYKLEIFARVVEAGSLSGAAQTLYTSHSAVSQHIKDLEVSLGVSLFDRGRRGVTLTPSGEKLYEHTQAILRQVALAEAEVTNVENLPEGQLSIGATPGVSLYFAPNWMRAFRERLPQISVSLDTGTTDAVVAGVLGRRVALGFVEGEIDANNDLITHIVLESIPQQVIVGPQHQWWEADGIRLGDLNGVQMITRQQNSRTRDWLDATLAKHNIRVQVVAEFDSPESIKRSVALSDCCATILPPYAVQAEVGAGMIRAVPVVDADLARDLSLITHATMPLSPLARAFLRALPYKQIQQKIG